jgi:hypothetical protein
MKKKKISKHQRQPSTEEIPDWVLNDSPLSNKPLTKQDLDELAAGVESGIRDTPAWKVLVSRVGEKEAARILRVSLFAKLAIQPDPNN